MAFLNRQRGTRQSFGHKVLAFVTSISMVLSMVVFPVPASADEGDSSAAASSDSSPSLGAPTISKTISNWNKETGTGTLTLSVTGKSQESTNQQNANVIFVADVSGSMNDSYGNTSRIDAAKEAIKSAGKTILDQNGTNVQLITFSNTASGSSWTTDEATFDRQVDGMRANGGTNWEDALTKAESIVSSSPTKNAPTYIIFVSDGDPTFRNSQVYTDEEWNANRYDSDYYYDYFNETNGYSVWHNSDGLYGTGNSDPKGWNFSAANTVAQRLVNTDGYKLYTLNVSDSTKMSNLTATDHFDANDPDQMNQALSQIAKTITNARSYKNVSITDNLSGDVVSGTADGESIDTTTIQKKVTDKDGNDVTSAESLNGPAVSGQNVTWDIKTSQGGEYTLKDGYTYSVSFKVKLTDQAYEDAAKLMNGDAATSSNIFKGNGAVKAYSNKDSGNKVDYTEFTTTNGVEDEGSENTASVNFDRPTVDVPTATLTVNKVWNGNGDKPAKGVGVDIKNDVNFSKSISLLEKGSWTSTVYVPAYPDANKKPTYTVTENTDGLSNTGWQLDSYQWNDGKTNTKGASGVVNGANKSATVTITNKLVRYDFQVFKTDDKSQALSGATFTLTPDGTTSGTAKTTDGKGYARFESLVPGTYTVEETNVPTGYQKLDGKHTLVISTDGTATWDKHPITDVQDAKDGSPKVFQVTVSNNTIKNLPSTGGFGVWPMLAGGVALVAAGIAFVIVRRREQ